jgi:hypothetical protein
VRKERKREIAGEKTKGEEHGQAGVKKEGD